MTLPRCPYRNCVVGRNLEPQPRTVAMSLQQAEQARIRAETTLFRCNYCDGVWQEPEPYAIIPVGTFTALAAFTPFSRPWLIEVARGTNRAPRPPSP